MDPFLDHLERDDDIITNGSRTTVLRFYCARSHETAVTPCSSALYNAISYGKIVLAQYRTHSFFFLMCFVGVFRHRVFVYFCVLLCSVQ